MFKLKDPEPVLFGEEVIWMDDRIAGYVSSGAYGFTLGASVGMGYVRHPDGVTRELVESSDWEIDIACERYPAEASLRAFYDPAGTRVGIRAAAASPSVRAMRRGIRSWVSAAFALRFRSPRPVEAGTRTRRPLRNIPRIPATARTWPGCW